jgi:hypothetical protein
VKVAVMVEVPERVKEHLPFAQGPPDHPVKREPRAGRADNRKIVPDAMEREQVLPQAMVPRGVTMLTVPLPVPADAMDSLEMLSSAAATSMRGLMIGLRKRSVR